MSDCEKSIHRCFSTHIAPPVVDGKLLFSKKAQDFHRVSLQISDACSEWGFFQLINHEVENEVHSHTWYSKRS